MGKVFYNLIEQILSVEWEFQGPDEELKSLTESMLRKVVSRLGASATGNRWPADQTTALAR